MKKLQLRFVHCSCSVLHDLIAFDKSVELDFLDRKLADCSL